MRFSTKYSLFPKPELSKRPLLRTCSLSTAVPKEDLGRLHRGLLCYRAVWPSGRWWLLAGPGSGQRPHTHLQSLSRARERVFKGRGLCPTEWGPCSEEGHQHGTLRNWHKQYRLSLIRQFSTGVLAVEEQGLYALVLLSC